MRGPRFWRLPLRFDAADLQADLCQIDALDWIAHFNAGYHDGGWQGAALISPGGEATRLYAGGHEGEPAALATPLLARCPALRQVLASLPGQPQSVRLLRLAPGSVIREHRDHGLGLADGLVRLHVPVVTHPMVEFYLDGVRVPMAVGECWYLDFTLPHRVQNLSPVERVHLVVDCQVDERLLALLPSTEQAEIEMQAMLASSEHLAAGLETSADRFERFRQTVLRDVALQAALCDIEDSIRFAQRVVELGRVNGELFTEEDVQAARQAGRRAWTARRVA